MIRRYPLPANITERIPGATAYLKSVHYIVFAYLFGGFGRGRVGPLSDLDIAVYFTDNQDVFDRRMALLDGLITRLGTEEIDLVILNNLENVPLVGRIIQSRTVIVDKDPFLRHRYESLALRQYFDFKPFELRLLRRKAARHG